MKKARVIKSVLIYGEDTAVTYQVYGVAVATGVPTLLGSGTIGTLLDIDDFSSGNQDNYLVFRFSATATSQTIYGGIMYRDDAGSTVDEDGLTPRDFFVNDD